jgi:site-specific DNA recombinase
MGTRVIGYIRVSTTTQAEEGVSLDVQKSRIEAYAFGMGLDLVRIEVDAAQSAKTLARPALQRALAALDAGEAEGLVVLKLDRLTRSITDLAKLLEQYFASRFTLLSLGDSIDTRTAGGRMVLNILTTVSQWEREVISERTKAALTELKIQGKKLGQPRMEMRAVESVRLVKELYATGGYSHRTLADELNRRNVRTSQGKKWWPTTVRVALNATLPEREQNPRPAGESASA